MPALDAKAGDAYPVRLDHLLVHSQVRWPGPISSQLRRERINASMQLTATCKPIEIGSGLREHIEASLGAILKKCFKTAIEAGVMFTKEAGLRRVEIALPTVRGIVVRTSASETETFTAFGSDQYYRPGGERRC